MKNIISFSTAIAAFAVLGYKFYTSRCNDEKTVNTPSNSEPSTPEPPTTPPTCEAEVPVVKRKTRSSFKKVEELKPEPAQNSTYIGCYNSGGTNFYINTDSRFISKSERRKRVPTDKDKEKIKKAYKEGCGLEVIAKKCGVSTKAAHRCIVEFLAQETAA